MNDRQGVPERLGKFRLLERIGAGGMGEVWRASQDGLGRPVALKLIRPGSRWFGDVRERFQREAEVLARVQHEGIVPVYAVGEEEGVPYFAMEYVHGASAGDLIAELAGRDPAALRGRDLGAAFRARLGADAEIPAGEELERVFGKTWVEVCFGLATRIADALAHAHESGVLHRDVKPSNVLVGVDGTVKLADFGLSIASGATRLTQSDTAVGSLAYMAPEQLTAADLGPATDVYQLGATLWELLTLRRAFEDADTEVLRRRIQSGDCPRPSRANPALSWDVDTVVATAMEHDPARRYDAPGLARDLRNVLALRPIEAKPPSVAFRIKRFAQRQPTLSVALLLGLLLVLVGPTALLLQQRAARIAARAELTRLERLADELGARTLLRQADALWPAVPARLPAFETWLGKARRLCDQLADHERQVAAIRDRALPYSEDDRAHDAASDAVLRKQIANLEKRLATLLRPGIYSAQVEADTRAAIAGAEARIGTRRTWQFSDARDTWLHERLVAMLPLVRELASRRDRVEREARLARRLERATIDEHRDLWTRTIAGIAASSRYGGLRVVPQLGLIPLGPDPRSGLFEFAHLATGTPPERIDGRLGVTAETGLVFVLVPGGRTLLGATVASHTTPYPTRNLLPGADQRERPLHEVTLEPFFLSKFEMTQAQWRRVTGRNPAGYSTGTPRGDAPFDATHPVENVSWEDCRDLLQRLGLLLPTEAQWEHAARGGTASPWWTGWQSRTLQGAENLADRHYAKNTERRFRLPFDRVLDDGRVFHAPAGSYRGNPFGLHDMLGNVQEWCHDRFGPYRFPARPGDGLRVPVGPFRSRAVRGGAYMFRPQVARVSGRNGRPPTMRIEVLGVRPARRVTPADRR